MILPPDVEGHFFHNVTADGSTSAPDLLGVEILPPQNSREHLNQLLRDPGVETSSVIHGLLDGIGMAHILNGDPGVARTTGIENLRTHNGLVIATFERFFSEADLPDEVDLLQFMVKLGLHDAIKPHAHSQGAGHQHKAHSASFIRPGMNRLGFSSTEIDLEVATVESDGVGRVTGRAAAGRVDMNEIIQVAGELSRYADAQTVLSREDFFRYKLLYFICDSFSYTSTMNPHRPVYFPESRIAAVYDMPTASDENRIVFQPTVLSALGQLRDQYLVA